MTTTKTVKQTKCWNCLSTVEYGKKDIKYANGHRYADDYIICPKCGELIILNHISWDFKN